MTISFSLPYTCLLLLLFSVGSHQYELGTVYEYDYDTSVLLNEPQLRPVSSAKDVGFKLQLKAEISPVWQHHADANEQIIQITISSPQLSVKARKGPTPDGFVDKSSRVTSLPTTPLFVHRISGRIHKVFSVKDEDVSSVNIKKGISSLLQVQNKDAERQDVDASGRCLTSYLAGSGGKVSKSKTNCVTDLNFNHTNKVLDADISSSASTSYELRPSDQVILKATGLETHFLKVEARKTSASEVIATQSLQLTGEQKSNVVQPVGSSESEIIKDLSMKIGQILESGDLSTEKDLQECIACKSLQDLVTNFKSALKAVNLGTQTSSLAFIRLLRKMRESSEGDIKSVLSSKKNAKVRPQLLDIIASTQTEASHKAALSVLKFREEDKIDLPERFLLTTSLSTHPSADHIKVFFNMAKRGLPNAKLQETLVYSVASLVRTFSRMPGDKKPLVDEVCAHFHQQLQKCDDVPCTLLHVSALKTLQQKMSIPILLKTVNMAPKKVSINAMRAIQTMPAEFIDDEIKSKLERIFLGLDRRHDSSVKIMAADLLVQLNPSEDFLKLLLLTLTDQTNKEVNTIVLSKLRDQLDGGDKILRETFNKVVKSPEFGNYHVMSQNGLSSAFSRPLSVGSETTANSSFTNVLEIGGGLLKRSMVDVFVDSDGNRMRLLSFGMFAGGLNMMGGGATEPGEEEEANAGIEITLMGTQLRPFVFFTSQGELMGHVWSGTASERTTALQGSALLHDHQQRVPLQNGFSVEMLLTGAVSYDFAGQVQISLWNQNAHSLVEIGAALVIQGQARVDTSFVQTMIETNTGVETRMDFVSDVEFGGGILMCMKMSQPNYEVVENVRKLERIPGSNYVLRKYKRRQIPGPGKTYVINNKNTMSCNKMFNNNY